MLKRFYTIISTGCYIGKIPFAPGTFGSLLAVWIWMVINYYFFNFTNSLLSIF